MKMLEVSGLNTDIVVNGRTYRALDNISFEMGFGETVGIAGESGSGKTLLALSLMGLLPEAASVSQGEILFLGDNILALDEGKRRLLRGGEMSMIFQEPMSALNPIMPVGKQIEEAFASRNSTKIREKGELKRRTLEIMSKTGLPRPESLYYEYPHRLSGGMRQRVMAATALINNPKLLIADEPTTALDATIQYQILEMMNGLAREFGSAVLLISHDIAVIKQVCERTIILYSGQIVEQAQTADILKAPRHPYTRALLDCIPSKEKKGAPLRSIPGSIAPLNQRNYGGCVFYPRCEKARPHCENNPPKLEGSGGRSVRCFYA